MFEEVGLHMQRDRGPALEAKKPWLEELIIPEKVEKEGQRILLWSNESSFYLQLRWLGRKSWSVKPSDIYAQRHSCLRLELYKSWCFGLYYKCQVIVNCIVTLLFILQIDTRIRDGNGNKNVIPDDPGTFLCFNRLYPWCGCLLLTHSTKGKDQTSLSNQPQS